MEGATGFLFCFIISETAPKYLIHTGNGGFDTPKGTEYAIISDAKWTKNELKQHEQGFNTLDEFKALYNGEFVKVDNSAKELIADLYSAGYCGFNGSMNPYYD